MAGTTESVGYDLISLVAIALPLLVSSLWLSGPTILSRLRLSPVLLFSSGDYRYHHDSSIPKMPATHRHITRYTSALPTFRASTLLVFPYSEDLDPVVRRRRPPRARDSATPVHQLLSRLLRSSSIPLVLSINLNNAGRSDGRRESEGSASHPAEADHRAGFASRSDPPAAATDRRTPLVSLIRAKRVRMNASVQNSLQLRVTVRSSPPQLRDGDVICNERSPGKVLRRKNRDSQPDVICRS